MRRYWTGGLAAAAMMAAAGSASALSMTVLGAECATDVTTTIPGLTPIALDCGTTPDRQIAANVELGTGDGDFYSLGLPSATTGFTIGGVIAFEIDPAFEGTAMLFEVTNPSNHLEAANVYVNSFYDWNTSIYVGTVDNGDGGMVAASNTVSITGGPWKYLFVADVSVERYGASASKDGYDLDAIKLTPVPLPAGVLLIGTALAGLGMLRRR